MNEVIENVLHVYHSPKGKTFKILPVETPDDHERIVQFFCDHDVQDEPALQILGWRKELLEDLSRLLGSMVKDNLSVMAEVIGTKDIAGAWISCNHTSDTFHKLLELHLKSIEMSLLLKMRKDCMHLANSEEAIGSSNYVDMFRVSVDRQYRREGIATELCKSSLKLFRTKGHAYAVAECTNRFSRNMLERLGFNSLSVIDCNDFLSFDGEKQLCGEVKDKKHFVTVYTKSLQERRRSLNPMTWK